MKSENVINNEIKNDNVTEPAEDNTVASASETTNADDATQPSATVQEVDTASINATEQDDTPRPKRRQRPKQKGRAVAGQISRLKLALLCLVPLLLAAFWTELAPVLAASGIRASLFDLPGAYEAVNLRGVLQ